MKNKTLLIFNVLFLLLFFGVTKTFANSYITTVNNTNSAAYYDDLYERCTPPGGCAADSGSCYNGPSTTDTGGCGSIACNAGNPWSQYPGIGCWQTSPIRCETKYGTSNAPVCSTADKYNDRYGGGDLTMLRYGDCSCTARTLYKTCCNGSTPVNTYNFTAQTGQGNPSFPDGSCNYTTVRCGDNGIPCGQAACGPIPTAPPPTTPPVPCPDPNSPFLCNGQCWGGCPGGYTCTPGGATCNSPSVTTVVPCQFGSCIPGTAQCSGNSRQTCDSTPSGWCWSAPAACQPSGSTCIGSGTCQTTTGGCLPGTTFCGGVCYDNTLCPYGFTNCSGAAQCLPSPAPITTTRYKCVSNSCVSDPTGTFTTSNCDNTCTPAPPPPPRCVINVNSNYSCVEPFMMSQSYMPYANGPTCNYEYWTFVNTCLNPPFRYIQPKLSSACVGQKYGCPPATVTGFVFLDLNNNGIRDYGEAPISSAISISAQYTPGPYKPAYCLGHTKNCCLANCSPFEWQGSLYSSSDCNTYCSACDLPNDPSVIDPSTCNEVCIGDGDTCWTWCPAPTPALTTQPQVSYPGGGSYRVSAPSGGDLLAGTYKVNYSLPSGFSSSEPPGSTSPFFSVIVGPGCSVDGSRNASCSGGSVSNLNFGVSVVNPWIQSTGNDIRVDAGFQNAVPAGASCGSYSSLAGGGGTSGIIYSGASSPSFGKGQASANNWIVGDPVNPETYSPTRPSLIRTSYSYLSSVAQQAAITPIDIASSCGSGGISNCNLSASLSNGLYIANGNLTLTGGGYSFPTNKNFVILVKGDLNIKEKIFVPNGSTATFSASGNITVDRAVGEASLASTATDVEGFYSADKNFIADGVNNCSTGPDSRLNIAGTVVVNAALGGGTFQNNRSLCSGNNQCPVFSVAERPDFVLNAPEFIKHPSYVWQENAP